MIVLNKRNWILITIINYLIIGLLIWLIPKFFDFLSFSEAINQLSVRLIIIYFIGFSITILLKGYRTTNLVQRDVSFNTNFQIVAIGNMLNTILPARLGDAYRGVAISTHLTQQSDTENLPIGQGVALTIIEKLMDLIILLLIGFIILIVSKSLIFRNEVIFFAFIISLIIVITFFLITIFAKKGSFFNRIIKYLFHKSLPDKFTDKFLQQLQISRDLIYMELRNIRKSVKIFSLSALVVLCDLFLVGLIINQFVAITLELAIFAGVVGFLSVIIPSLPAGVGPYQFGIASIVLIAGGNLDLGLQAGFIELLLRSIGYIFFGIIEISISGVSNTKKILQETI